MKILKTSKESPDAARIREAIGVGPDEEVTVTTPQFDRTPDMPPACKAPRTPEEWNELRGMSALEMKALGCGLWSSEANAEGKVLVLFPHEWYASIPQGFDVEDINGSIEKFEPGETDDDKRFGCLAYGIRVVQEN